MRNVNWWKFSKVSLVINFIESLGTFHSWILRFLEFHTDRSTERMSESTIFRSWEDSKNAQLSRHSVEPRRLGQTCFLTAAELISELIGWKNFKLIRLVRKSLLNIFLFFVNLRKVLVHVLSKKEIHQHTQPTQQKKVNNSTC